MIPFPPEILEAFSIIPGKTLEEKRANAKMWLDHFIETFDDQLHAAMQEHTAVMIQPWIEEVLSWREADK